MKQRLKTIFFFLFLISIAGLLSWHSIRHMNRVYKPIKVGVSAGPQAEIMRLVQRLVDKDGINLQIVVFNDYTKLNEALYRGDININSFQHQPYLNTVIADRNYDFTAIGKTIILPMGIYSKKINTITDLPVGSIVAIPKDLVNSSRALLLLERAGLVTLRQLGYTKSVKDILDNPMNLTFLEVEAEQINRLVDTVDLAVMNASYAFAIGFIPTKDALVLEDSNSPYFNLLVVRCKDKESIDLKKVVKAYQSEEVKSFIQGRFQGTLLTAW